MRSISVAGALLLVCSVFSGADAQTSARTSSATRIGLVADPAIAAAVRDVSPARIRATDSVLVSFGTRHTMSDTLSATRGIGAARRWIYSRLKETSASCGGCLRVEYDPAQVVVRRHPEQPTVNVVNVLAWLPGRDTTRVIVLGGHYDSCVCSAERTPGGLDPRFDATTDAPGADDDGSGTSAVMELARVFAARYPKGFDATVVLALYSGEELGLLGSQHLAERLHASGYKIVAGMTDDMVGNVSAEDGEVDSSGVRIYAAAYPPPRTHVDSIVANSREGDASPSRELGRYVWGLGATYLPKFAVRPTFRLDRIGRGGDHAPFYQYGDPALRFSEPLENYKRQHRPLDLMKDVNFGFVANVARLNLATVASLAQAPPTPDSTIFRRDATSGGKKWQLSWRAVPGAASYEVLVRSTIAPTYERVIPVGSATNYLLDRQLDDAWAAVRSVDAKGHRSLTTVFQATR